MTTATSLLEHNAELGFALELEGVDVAFYTRTEIYTAWSGGRKTTAHYGLEIPGAIGRSIDMLGFSLHAPTCQLRIIDVDNTLASLFRSTNAVATNLTAAIDRDDVNLTTATTAGFMAGGSAYVGHEMITLDDPGLFTGVTRGVGGFGGKATWGHAFRLHEGYGAEVTTAPIRWRNRGVTLYMVAKDNAAGTWSARADSKIWFCGTIDDLAYDSDSHSWTLECSSIEKKLQGQLLRDQFTARVREGFYLGTENIQIHEHGPATNQPLRTITVPAGSYTIPSLLQTINGLLEDAHTGGDLAHKWALELDETYGPRVKLSVTISSASASGVGLWFQLGAEDRTGPLPQILGYTNTAAGFVIQTATTGTGVQTFSYVAPRAPVRAIWAPDSATVYVDHVAGSWITVDSSEMPGLLSDEQGYVMIGQDAGILTLCQYADTGSGTGTITRKSEWTLDGQRMQDYSPTEQQQVVYYDQEFDIPVKQVWVTRSTIVRAMLRMILSTGTDGYNDATWDKWPASMSAGIPSTLVDIGKFTSLGPLLGFFGQVPILITEPMSMAEFLSSIMAAGGFYIGWGANGKLRPFVPFEIATGATATWTIGGADLIGPVTVDMAHDLERDRLTLCYNRDPRTGEYANRETYDHLAVQDENEEPAAFTIECPFLHDSPGGERVKSWREHVAAPLVAYFSRGLRRVRCRVSRRLFGLCPGDTVALTCERAPSASGSYGI